MKWYIEKLEELKKAVPVYSVCGDDCAVCPRHVAETEEELHETALFWHRIGWRDRVLSNEEIKCSGCGSHEKCSFMILPCTKEKGVEKCEDCKNFCCDKIHDVLSRSSIKEEEARALCKSEDEFQMLKRAFWNKEKNLGIKTDRS